MKPNLRFFLFDSHPATKFWRRIPLLLLLLLLLVLPLAGFGQANYATPYAFTTLAGGDGSGSDDGIGNAARFSFPRSVAVDTNGNVYVADTFNSTIRKVTSAGVVTTLAGLAGSSGSTDGTGNAARFNRPAGVAVDTNGNVYVADSENHTIRIVTPARLVTTVAGLALSNGSADGIGSAARFKYPNALAVDGAGNIYVADTYNHTIRKVTSAGVVTTLAGLAGSSGSVNGLAADARFNTPYGVAVGANGNVYVSDTYNHTIRKITPAAFVTTLAGLSGVSGSTDGPAAAARFNSPEGIALDTNGSIYVAEYNNHTIRKVTSAGVVTTLAGRAGFIGSTDGTGNAALFTYPDGLAVDRVGNVYVADESNAIRKGSPVVQFTANLTSGRVPLVVQFNSPNADFAGNAITNWNWAFGDGSTSTAQNPSHTYTSPGTFQPSLTVTNNNGIGIPGFGPAINARGLELNGGFESGSFSSWALVGQMVGYNVVDTFNQSSEGMQPRTPSSYFARLGQTGSLGYLSQTVATTPGAKYLLSFWLNSPDGLTPNQFLVSWNGSQIYSANNLPAFGNNPAIAWSNFQFTVTATASATVLQFGFRDDPTGLGLDDVSVVQISPAITLQPQNKTVTCQSNATFTVAASGPPPLSYQWRSNGVLLAGATNTAHSVTPLTCQSPDNYSVVVTNSSGSVTSTVATLTVVDTNSPVVTCPANMLVSTGPGQSSVVVNYSVAATDNCAVVSLSLNPPSGSVFPIGSNLVTCVAVDCAGQSNTCSFIISVVPGVFPTNAVTYGKTYSEWVAAFWKWNLEYPLAGHPALEHPTFDLSLRQSGPVWFWAAPDMGERTSTMPAGTALFLTLRDVECSSLESPDSGFHGDTEAEQRTCADYWADHITNVFCVIDGVTFSNVNTYRVSSPQFQFNAPTPWIFGDPTNNIGGSGTSVGDGYYLMLAPLSEGAHLIHYGGTFHFNAGELGPDPLDLPKDITINLTVTPPAVKIALNGNNVILSWPQTSSSYVLQTSSNLSPGTWSQSSASVSALEGRNEVTLPTGNGTQFFRLKKN